MKKNKAPQSLPVKNTPGYDTYHQIQSRTQPTPQISTNSAIVELERKLKLQKRETDWWKDEAKDASEAVGYWYGRYDEASDEAQKRRLEFLILFAVSILCIILIGIK